MFHTQEDLIKGRLLPTDDAAGALVVFEGAVRDLNEGLQVEGLEYEAFEPLASAEGTRIVEEAAAQFALLEAACVHRVGKLTVGEVAIRVEVRSRHRDAAFDACRYIVDEVKKRVPIWKREKYSSGFSTWINAGEMVARKEEESEFYRRQMRLPEVGEGGQEILRAARVAVVGAGGLGCAALAYMAAAGVGEITIVDSDLVETSNLHRQPLFDYADRGRPKAEVAAEKLRAQNPFVQVSPSQVRLNPSNLASILAGADLVLDCSDNFPTKFMLSDFAARGGPPVVSASLYQFDGYLQVVRPNGPCLRCLWPVAPEADCVGNCADVGVLGATAGVFGTLQAAEALRLLLNLSDGLEGKMFYLDLKSLESRVIFVPKTMRCPGCGTGEPHLKEDVENAMEIEPTSDLSAYKVIDIREASETTVQPLEGALRLPLSSFAIEQLPEGNLAIVCQHGVRSLRLTRHLHEQGIERAVSVRGGVAMITGKDLA